MAMDRKTQQLHKHFLHAYDQYADALFRFLFYRVKQNKAVAEDLLAQTFCNVWLAITRKGEIEHLQAFCYRTARNLAIDYARSGKQKYEIGVEDEILERIPDNTPLEQSIDIALSTKRLKELMNTLAPQYAEIIHLRFTEEMSIKEIAQILDSNPNAVSVKIHRSLKALKSSYENQSV